MSSLSEVTEQLKDNKEATEDTTDEITRLRSSIDKFILNQERQGLDALEEMRESAGRGRTSDQITVRDSESTSDGPFGGLLKALGITSVLGGITKLLGPVLVPITALYAWLKGPKVLKMLGVFGLMYEIFRDIGENETLQKSLKNITDLWNNSMKPALQSIGDTVLGLINSIDTTTEFASIKDWWDNFKTTVQDFVALTLEDVTIAIDGVITGIKTTLEGDWKTGLSKIVNSVLIGIQDIADNAITAVLKVFGVDFGEDGTFLGFLDRKWAELKTSITNTWNNVTTAITDGWQSIVDFFTISIPAKFEGIKLQVTATANEIYNSVVDAATGMIEVITVDIPNKIGEVKNAIVEKATGLYDSVMTKVNSLITSVVDLIPSAEDIKKNLIQTIQSLPGGEALLDLLGVEYQKTPERLKTENDFFEQEMRLNKGLAINPMAYPGAVPFGTAYTTTPKAKFEELMAFRQPAGTIAAPVVQTIDNSVKSTGGNTQVINQFTERVSPYDMEVLMRRSRPGFGPYGY